MAFDSRVERVHVLRDGVQLRHDQERQYEFEYRYRILLHSEERHSYHGYQEQKEQLLRHSVNRLLGRDGIHDPSRFHPSREYVSRHQHSYRQYRRLDFSQRLEVRDRSSVSYVLRGGYCGSRFRTCRHTQRC